MSREANTLARQYNQGMAHALLTEYYGHSGFFNYGYWTADTADQATASRNLVHELARRLPQKPERMLDVACGTGATTATLLDACAPAQMVGINISQEQLDEARSRAPQAEYALMDAARLGFANATFEAVVSVEAAFHFNTRQRFLAEAHRVLKPGGRLALSDILFMGMPGRRRRRLPNENFVTDLEQYRAQFVAAGFKEVEVEDATVPCWIGFRNGLMRWGWRKLRAGHLDLATWSRHLIRLLIGSVAIRHYVLAVARKE